DDCLHFFQRNVGGRAVDDDLDAGGSIVERLANGLTSTFRAANRYVLLLDNGLCFGNKAAELSTLRSKCARRGNDARTGKPTIFDGIAKCSVAVDSGVSQIAHSGDSGLQNFAAKFRTEKSAQRRTLRGDDAQHLDVLQRDVGAVHFG